MSVRRSTRVATRNVPSEPQVAFVPPPPTKRKAQTSAKPTGNKKSKQDPPVEPEKSPFKRPTGPVTPLKSRSKASSKTAPNIPPLTPTPSLVNVLRASYSSGDIDDATPPPAPLNRPVEPHTTNATLVTPGGGRSVAYHADDSPTKATTNGDGFNGRLPAPTATTGTLLDQACAHLIKVDSRMKPLIEKHRCAVFAPEGLAEQIDPFRSLVSGICGQQVSGAAAKSIKNKFVALFNEGNDGTHAWPSPATVAATSIERLRTAGLSQRKAEYVQGLAQKFADGELTTQMLMTASDEEVMEKLIAVRGLGKWSVEMFACFGLKRMDILSTGDLGVQRGMAAYFGKDVAKLKAKGGGKWKYMSEQEMLDKSAIYSPYRSLFMWYMWRVEDVDVTVMDNS